MSRCESNIRRVPAAMFLVMVLACGGDGPTDPPDAVYGETTVVYVMNPVINHVVPTGARAVSFSAGTSTGQLSLDIAQGET